MFNSQTLTLYPNSANYMSLMDSFQGACKSQGRSTSVITENDAFLILRFALPSGIGSVLLDMQTSSVTVVSHFEGKELSCRTFSDAFCSEAAITDYIAGMQPVASKDSKAQQIMF